MTAATIPDTKPGPYYVSAIRDASGDPWYPVSGPYKTHKAALAQVEPARVLCEKLDARALWMSFGTVRTGPGGYDEPGSLQRAGYDLKLRKVAA